MIEVWRVDIGAPSLVPPGAPLPMPQQNLTAWNSRPAGNLSSWRVHAARLFVFAVAALLAGYGSWQMYEVVGQRSATSLQILLVVLFAITFSWIALSAATALLGFFAMIAGRISSHREASAASLSTRTAIIMPIYNEDTDAVFQALTRMATDIERSGHGRSFDIFVLSDSTDVRTLQRERAAANRLRSLLNDNLNVYYRKRLGNEAKKAGNVADFVRRWGAAYDYMVVLDADSYMTANAFVSLARAMEADPHAGLVVQDRVVAVGHHDRGRVVAEGSVLERAVVPRDGESLSLPVLVLVERGGHRDVSVASCGRSAAAPQPVIRTRRDTTVRPEPVRVTAARVCASRAPRVEQARDQRSGAP